MSVTSCRKQTSSFRPRLRWEPAPLTVNRKINAGAILKALDRAIRQQEKKQRGRADPQRSCADPRDLSARRTFSAPIRRTFNRKSVPKTRKNVQLKGILRKSSSPDNVSHGSCSDFEGCSHHKSPYAARKGFSMCDIEPTIGGTYGKLDVGAYRTPFQRSPQKVRFDTDVHKSSKCQPKLKWMDYPCSNDNLFYSDHPNLLNSPERNLSSNKAMPYDWLDLKNQWGDANTSHGNNSIRSSNKGSPSQDGLTGLDQARGEYKFSGDAFNLDMDLTRPNKFNHDLYGLNGKPHTWSTVFSDVKSKPTDVYYNPNFEKLEKLITTPLNNIDMLIEKYRSHSDYIPKSTRVDWKFSLRNLIGSSLPTETPEKKSLFQRDEKAINDFTGPKSTFDKSFYLNRPFVKAGQFSLSPGLAPRSSQISISSSESYGNFHSDQHQNNFSENNLTTDESQSLQSPIKQSEVPVYPGNHDPEAASPPLRQSPTKSQDLSESPHYLDPQCDNENNDYSDNHRVASESEYDGGDLGSPTIQSSKLSLDLDEADDTARGCCKTCLDECNSPPRGDQAASSAGDSSPIVFESSSTSYEDLLQKYKTSSNTKCHSWMPQSKVLQDILQDEYDGPWSRKKRFETEDPKSEITSPKYNEEKSEVESVQDLINTVNVNLAEVCASEIQSKEQDNRFDLTELKRRMSRLAMERF